MRVLFASTRGSGHFQPLVPLIDACTARGDDVLVVAPPALEPLLATRKQPYRIGGEPPREELAQVMEQVLALPPHDGVVMAVGEVFGRRCTAAMLPALDEACRDWRPDLVLHESFEFASVVAAERHGIPHARVAVSAARFTSATDPLLPPVLDAYGPGITQRLLDSPYLTRLPASMDPSPYAVTHRYHEPLRPGVLPDWWGGAEEPLVNVTLGTEAGALPTAVGLYRAVVDAVSALPVRVLLTTGHHIDASDLGPLPPHVHVEPWVPQADVLRGASLVVCHGGSGTVYGALAAGVPLVCVPLFADQPENADLVTGAGAGMAVPPTGGPADEPALLGPDDVRSIRAAAERILAEPSYRARAERLADEMGAAVPVEELLGIIRP
ncbi:glycosyltransferase [Streptomyces sp. NPDC007076]|uniref:glycosyltransferase n=1 Tax=unclassified Streptomyces TaxID=2593676 RepID=UPI002E770766|nr:glycosyltransferase [Streptomyces sp. JV190]MEE1841168.1 glycosyltransferase [Streptomyces sp. JV190]